MRVTTGCCFVGVLERMDQIVASESVHIAEKEVGKLFHIKLLSRFRGEQ